MARKLLLDYLKGKSPEEVYEYLKNKEDLNKFDKNIIYIYLFPGVLADKELLGLYKNLQPSNKEEGEIREDEVLLLLRAYRTRQYRGYIRHLLHSFVKNSDKLVIDSEGKLGSTECGICGKLIYDYPEWLTIGNGDKDSLVFKSEDSSIVLCQNCILQLTYLNEILEDLEGYDYLSWNKRSY